MPKSGIVHVQQIPILISSNATLATQRNTPRTKTMAAVDHISTPKFSLFCAPVALAEAAWARFTQYRMYRKTLDELATLTRRELADLGLNRSMLKNVAREAAYGSN